MNYRDKELSELRALATAVRDAWTIMDVTLNPLDEACKRLDEWLTGKRPSPERGGDQ